jgi:hypothetical protein
MIFRRLADSLLLGRVSEVASFSQWRSLASASSSGAGSIMRAEPGIVEIREYTLSPAGTTVSLTDRCFVVNRCLKALLPKLYWVLLSAGL